MTISVIGWYGTETLGDRAILDGIFIVLSKMKMYCDVKIGSLYPFFTERTLFEDGNILGKSIPINRVSIFDMKDEKCRDNAIISSDLVLVGGGPLMDIEELFLLKKAMILAKKREINTVIMGCGLGPLNNKEYIGVVEEILSLATKISFRDKLSKINAALLYGEKFQIECIGDPAVISIENYKHHNVVKTHENCVVVNFRDYPQNEYGKILLDFYSIECEMLYLLSKQFDYILLVPMHTFAIGGDDRYYLSKVADSVNCTNIEVQQAPVNLEQLYAIYGKAYGCIGMRYHAVVMQTILNGNNLILDYTGKAGKIRGFLDGMDKYGFYKNRVYNMESEKEKSLGKFVECLMEEKRFEYSFSTMINKYIEFLEPIVN